MSSDIDPETGLPFVPLGVLQSALWASSDLQTRITSQKSNSAGGSDAAPGSTGLAITARQVADDLEQITRALTSPRLRNRRLAATSSSSSGRSTPHDRDATASPSLATPGGLDKRYWPVPTDGTVRVGDVASALFFPSHPPPELDPASGVVSLLSTRATLPSADTYFGFQTSSRLARDVPVDSAPSLWAVHEPFRFSAEFWNIDALGERERAYSTTQFHAGSYFNVYVQMIRKKDRGVQLGVYLHRQSMLEPLPSPSEPKSSPAMTVSARPRAWTSNAWSPPGGMGGESSHAMQRTRSGPSPALGTSPPPPSGTHALGPHAIVDDVEEHRHSTTTSSSKRHAPPSPYRDPRKTTRVYFSISCSSALGTALTRFSSGPDLFTVSQSWGWKSSSLRSQEYLVSDGGGGDESLDDGVLGWVSQAGDAAKLKSLRVTVVMGVL